MEAGSFVVVSRQGKNYESYSKFLIEQGHPEWLDRFSGQCQNGDYGRILHKGSHGRIIGRILCIVELFFEGGPLIVINEEGLTLAEERKDWCLSDFAEPGSIDDLLGM